MDYPGHPMIIIIVTLIGIGFFSYGVVIGYLTDLDDYESLR